MTKRDTQRITMSGLAILDCEDDKESNVTPENAKDLRIWFIMGAQWADEDVLKMINDFVEYMRQFKRLGYYEHGFQQGIEAFAEYMTEKLTK